MIEQKNLAGSFTLPGKSMTLNRMDCGALQPPKLEVVPAGARLWRRRPPPAGRQPTAEDLGGCAHNVMLPRIS
jgi:hypothetical protein